MFQPITKKVVIELTGQYVNPSVVGKCGTVTIYADREIKINFKVEMDSVEVWSLKCSNGNPPLGKISKWKTSAMFPKRFPTTAWEDGKIIGWISNYLDVLLYLIDENRTIPYDE